MVDKLIVAPHIDDEVLGCGGILDESCFVYVCGVDESHFREDQDPTPASDRLAEMDRAAQYLGFDYEANLKTRVNHYTVQEIIPLMEDAMNKHRPKTVFLPHPGYNQDHRVVYDAALVALRPHDRNHFVGNVLIYEAPHDLIWDPARLRVNLFTSIDVERKIEAYLCHRSQVRSMRSPELIRHIAAVRGASINQPYAEGYQVLRWVQQF